MTLLRKYWWVLLIAAGAFAAWRLYASVRSGVNGAPPPAAGPRTEARKGEGHF